MGGGIIQLQAWGSQNQYVMGNPSLTFFKKVFKTHSNFSMESIKVSVNRTDVNLFEPTIIKAKLPRNGDLVSQMYLCFTLPAIVSDSFTRFRWLPNVGEAIIQKVTLSIGNVVVDEQCGEFMNILNNVTLPSFRRDMYNKMVGNISALTDPFKEQVFNSVYSDSRLRVGKIYPSAVPTLPEHRCYVPLQFWFKRFSQALPIIALQFMDIEVTIELRPFYQVYQLYYYPPGSNVAEYRAPQTDNPDHHFKKYAYQDVKKYLRSDALVDLNISLEVNYIFLDDDERNFFMYKPLEYLVEQTTRVDMYRLKEFNVVDIRLQNLVKELFWVFRRSDASSFNGWFDYLDKSRNIMKTARFMFNGTNRIEDKEWQFYNYLVPFQHHTGDPTEGVFCWTFALNPDDGLEQPSGCCNFSKIDKLQLVTTLATPSSSDYAYDLVMFATGYNILRINGGIASLLFSK